MCLNDVCEWGWRGGGYMTLRIRAGGLLPTIYFNIKEVVTLALITFDSFSALH